MCIFLRKILLIHPSLTFMFKSNFRSMGVFKWRNNIRNCCYRAPIRLFNHRNIRNTKLIDDRMKTDLMLSVAPLVRSERVFDPDNVGEPEFARFMLFNDENNDLKIKELNECASAEDVLQFINTNLDMLNDKYVTQIVLVLTDLQVIFCKVCSTNSHKARIEFLQKLIENRTFVLFLNHIENLVENDFEPNLLSHTLVHLSKLGIPAEAMIIQNISVKLRDHILKKFTPKYTARLFKVIFKENSIRPYYISLNIIPHIFDNLKSCKDTEVLLHLTTSLNRINVLVNDSHLKMYKDKVNSMIDNNMIVGKHYKLLLKILLFLNYPQWREKNSLIISRCILLLKDSIHLLSIAELEILYDVSLLDKENKVLFKEIKDKKVFFKNQEPGEILNSIQRFSAKYLQEFEESGSLEIETKLKLFSSLIYFCSPTYRSVFRKDAGKYLAECDDLRALFLLRKIYSYLKVADENICEEYWNNILKALKSEEKISLDIVVAVVDNYIYFYTDIDNYRNYEFEMYIFKLLKQVILEKNITLYPDKFFVLFNFVMANVRNINMVDYFMDNFKQLQNQLSANDCLKISQTMHHMQYDNRRRFSDKHIDGIREILNRATKRIHDRDQDFNTVSKLIRSSIYRNSTENETFDELLQTYKEQPFIASKSLENICHIFQCTSILIPEVLNKCIEYIVNNKNNILAFNAEKVLFTCFSLNYYPIHADKFFDAVTDLIIRDQERLSGLAFVQSVLSLCYFGKVSKSLVKHIFNVEFLDKLDVELANCYSRDTYPHRVRKTLMELNRAVCLEFPEYYVPWFHQKYIEETQRQTIRDDLSDVFHLRVKDYLVGVLGQGSVAENIVTPYGYNIDFVINLGSDNQPPFKAACASVSTKLALLLWTESKYTRLYTHLKGRYQMQIRHLEILGYKVKVIKFNEWMNLLYARERIDYITNIVFSK